MSGGTRSLSGTPPFRERMRQAYGNSPTSSPAPFQAGSQAHPNFAPAKLGSKATSQSAPKPPKAPEKPLMPYMRYSRKIWDSVKAKNPELRLWQIGKIIGQMWRELSEQERKEYNDAYEADKIQFQENLKVYHNSPQYQNYLREKQRADLQVEEEERRSKSAAMTDHRVSIQPADYETDTDGGMSIKNIAAARYHRNHALVNEIFSDSLVPDGRSVVTEQRMTVLKKQVRSLMEHQQKLEKELSDIKDKFEDKKRKFLESSDDFGKRLKEECDSKPVMTSARFDAMVIKHKAELRVKYEKMIEQQRKDQERAAAEQAAVQQHILEQQAVIDQQQAQQQCTDVSPQSNVPQSDVPQSDVPNTQDSAAAQQIPESNESELKSAAEPAPASSETAGNNHTTEQEEPQQTATAASFDADVSMTSESGDKEQEDDTHSLASTVLENSNDGMEVSETTPPNNEQQQQSDSSKHDQGNEGGQANDKDEGEQQRSECEGKQSDVATEEDKCVAGDDHTPQETDS